MTQHRPSSLRNAKGICRSHLVTFPRGAGTNDTYQQQIALATHTTDNDIQLFHSLELALLPWLIHVQN
jgi:hypothetical protein